MVIDVPVSVHVLPPSFSLGRSAGRRPSLQQLVGGIPCWRLLTDPIYCCYYLHLALRCFRHFRRPWVLFEVSPSAQRHSHPKRWLKLTLLRIYRSYKYVVFDELSILIISSCLGSVDSNISVLRICWSMAYYRYGRICHLLILLIEGIEFIDVYILSIIEFGNCPKLKRISIHIFQENFGEFPLFRMIWTWWRQY